MPACRRHGDPGMPRCPLCLFCSTALSTTYALAWARIACRLLLDPRVAGCLHAWVAAMTVQHFLRVPAVARAGHASPPPPAPFHVQGLHLELFNPPFLWRR